jgi:hypothetical protein
MRGVKIDAGKGRHRGGAESHAEERFRGGHARDVARTLRHHQPGVLRLITGVLRLINRTNQFRSSQKLRVSSGRQEPLGYRHYCIVILRYWF